MLSLWPLYILVDVCFVNCFLKKLPVVIMTSAKISEFCVLGVSHTIKLNNTAKMQNMLIFVSGDSVEALLLVLFSPAVHQL